ncbi:MAG: dihydrodipicolinate synthase family protein [Hyphomicrobiaceae bacterium]
MSRFGLSAALATPFERSGALDVPRLVAHAQWCLANGCDSITLFGTTGEGASIGLSARHRAIAAAIDAGIAPRTQLLCAVAASSIEDVAAQAALALDAGCRGVLLTPPFYFRGVDDDALFAWFGQLFDRLGARARDMFAYHLPDVTGMPLSVSLIGRLKTAFPGTIVGVKDSSADWANTAALLDEHSDLTILVGDERDLAKAVRLGGSGTICGLANVAPEILTRAAHDGHDDPRIRPVVEAIGRFPVLPAVKALIAHQKRDPAWRTMRPPLADLDAGEIPRLVSAFESALALVPA